MHNPFSASRLAAGQIPYRYPAGLDPDLLLLQFSNQGHQGTLIGPHGIGKTTLAIDLARRLRMQAAQQALATIRHRRRSQGLFGRFYGSTDIEITSLTSPSRVPTNAGSHSAQLSWRSWRRRLEEPVGAVQELWIIDGVERLCALRRYYLMTMLRRRRSWFMITLHRPLNLGIPKLCELNSIRTEFVCLAMELQRDVDLALSQEAIAAAWDQAEGIPRVAFDKLYEQYEQLENDRRKSNSPAEPLH
jgi:DNA polymerase III delta prime subunit